MPRRGLGRLAGLTRPGMRAQAARRPEFLLILAGLCAGLALAEGLARFFGLAEYGGGEGPARADRAYRYNSAGFRGREDPASGEGRPPVVLGLGDSFAFGQGVALEDTLFARLERALNEDGAAAIVLNRARQGMNAAAELAYLEARGLTLQPKAVLLCLTLNDAETDMYRYRALTPWPEWETRVLRRSHLFFYLTYAYNSYANSYKDYVLGLYEAGAPGLAEFRRSLKRMAALCRERDIRPVLALFPLFDEIEEGEEYPYAALHGKIRGWAEEDGWTFVDLLEAYEAAGKPLHAYRVSYGDGHPNAAAHAEAALAVLPAVRAALRE